MIEYHTDDETLTDDEKFEWVREHVDAMEKGTHGTFFAPEGGPSSINEVRGDEIATDYLNDRGWHLREEWAADLETYIHERRDAYGLTWWDEEDK